MNIRFAVPLAGWFRGPLQTTFEKRLLGDTLRQMDIFDLDYVRTLFKQHTSGVRDHNPPISALLDFQGFLRNLQ